MSVSTSRADRGRTTKLHAEWPQVELAVPNRVGAGKIEKSDASRHLAQWAYDEFLLYNRAQRLAAKTQAYYRCQLAPFLQWCAAHQVETLAAFSARLIRAYLISLEERGLRDTSVHAAARAIRVFFNFCVREGWLAVSPMRTVAMPRLDRRVLPALSVEQVKRLLRVAKNSRDHALVLFLLDTGCRASEVVNLNWGDIDLDQGDVQIRRGKGRKGRTVFLGHQARTALRRYFEERGRPRSGKPVWVSQTRGLRMTPSGLHQLLKRLGAQARVAHCAPHTFRRTFAIWSLRNGMDLFRLARLMGHSDISVLRQYLHLLKDDLRAAHAQYGGVDLFLGT